MSEYYSTLADNEFEEFDKVAGKAEKGNFQSHEEFWWFLLAKTALWGLFALVEAVRNLRKKQYV
jgi:hypothetical protein